jgi:hypothetical protein
LTAYCKQGIAVQDEHQHLLFGCPECFSKRGRGRIYELQGGNEGHNVEVKVWEGEMFGKTLKNGKLETNPLSGQFNHIPRGINSRRFHAAILKPPEMKAGTAPHIQDGFSGLRIEQPFDKPEFMFQVVLAFGTPEPPVITFSGSSVEYKTHGTLSAKNWFVIV